MSDPLSECLRTFAEFFGGYREGGVRMTGATVDEFTRMFEDMSARARELEDRAGAAVAWTAIAAAVNDGEGNVKLFPVVRRPAPPAPSPPRPVPRGIGGDDV